jgi:hypothetical protein
MMWSLKLLAMKIYLYNKQTPRESTEFSVCLPTICWDKQLKAQIGGDTNKTMLDLSTGFCIITSKDSLDITISILGFGIHYYTRIK